MDAGCPHYAVYNSRSCGDIVRQRVDDEESFYLLLMNYMQDMGDAELDIQERYRQKYRGQHFLHALLFSGGDAISLDGKRLAFSGEYLPALFL
jgi:hypothetical protein